jgi:hypothetical protein
MNRIAKIAALLVVLTAAFSFSQENTRHLDSNNLERIVSDLEAEQSTIKKSVDSLGNVEKKAFQEAQKFYNDFLSFFIAVVSSLVAILAAITAVLISINFKSNENLKKEYEKLKEEYEKFSDFENKVGVLIKETTEKERKENESKFNGAYKKIAELYYISARDELSKVNESKDEKDKNEHWFYHFAYLASFYYALNRMSKLSNNEIHFIRFVKKFTDEYNKCTLMPDVKFFHHFLPFIEYSENINGIIFEETKIIYNKLLKIFDYNKITEYIGKSEFGEEKERDQKLLTLAKRYKDKEYLKRFDFDKLQEGTQNASENNNKSC